MLFGLEITEDEMLTEARKRMRTDMPDEVPERLVRFINDAVGNQLEPFRPLIVRYLGEMIAAVTDLGEANPELPAYLQEITTRFVQAIGESLQ